VKRTLGALTIAFKKVLQACRATAQQRATAAKLRRRRRTAYASGLIARRAADLEENAGMVFWPRSARETTVDV
jgi:hypothetical protein